MDGKKNPSGAQIVEGGMRKYFEEVALLEQVYVIDGESRVSKVVEAAAADVGAPVRVAGFVRCSLRAVRDIVRVLLSIRAGRPSASRRSSTISERAC